MKQGLKFREGIYAHDIDSITMNWIIHLKKVHGFTFHKQDIGLVSQMIKLQMLQVSCCILEKLAVNIGWIFVSFRRNVIAPLVWPVVYRFSPAAHGPAVDLYTHNLPQLAIFHTLLSTFV